MKQTLISLISMIASVILGCIEADPAETEETIDTEYQTGPRNACLDDAFAEYTEDLSECVPLESDYTPSNPDGDGWAACISDDNTYHRIEESVSSIARVEAYDAMGALLWNTGEMPIPQDFIDAKAVLETEEGLGSRLDRRYDVHFEPPANGAKCDEEGVAEEHPDYCVGPAVLRPLLNNAFAEGASGNAPAVNAEIIHAALQWFLYVSAIKESTTCAETAKDCDSGWAYYSGGTDRNSPIGLAAEIADIAPKTHDRAYDGVLAVRCRQDLNSEENASDLDLWDQAILQLDTALLHGMSVLIRQRFVAIGVCTDAAEKVAAHEALKVLVPLFDRAARERDADAAEVLMQQIEEATDTIDADAALAAIDAVFECP